MAVSEGILRSPGGTAADANATNDLPDSANFSELRRAVIAAGLYNSRPLLNLGIGAIALSAYIGGFALAAFSPNLWVIALAAVIETFGSGQVGFFMHDAGHQQVFRSGKNNRLLGLMAGFLVGASSSWWVEKHNRHHAQPNVVGEDPDINLGIFAFSEEQGRSYGPLFRFFIRFQAFTFLPLLSLEGFGLKVAGVQHLVFGRNRNAALELTLMAVHHVIYFAFLLYFTGIAGTLVFMTVHHLLSGFYFSAVFAPNHKGMPVFNGTPDLDFLELQVSTSRNIRNSRLVDFMYGGLNFQVEHHLFPSMPRGNLGKAARLVRPFCKQKNLPYYETGFAASYVEILRHLHRVSRDVHRREAAAI